MFSSLAVPSVLCALSGFAAAQTPPLEVVYTSLAGHPHSLAPGTNARFTPDWFTVVANGPHVAIGARIESGTGEHSVLLLDDQLLVQTGDVLPGMGTVTTLELLHVNRSGTVVAKTAVDTLTEFFFVAWRRAAPPTVHGVAGRPCPLEPGATWGGSGHGFGRSAGIDDGERFWGKGIADHPLTGLTFGVYHDGAFVARQSLDPPLGQIGGAQVPWAHFAAHSASADGRSIALSGHLIGWIRVFAVNNVVVLQSGMPNPVGPGTLIFAGGGVDAVGRRISIVVSDASSVQHVLIDEVRSHSSGQPMHPLTNEQWIAGWYPMTNAYGDVLVRGEFAPAPSNIEDVALVANGATQVLHAGDPVDVDGNGQYDDDAYARPTTGTALAALTDGRSFYANARLYHGDGTPYPDGIVLLRGELGDYELGTAICSAAPNTTGRPARMTASGSTSIGANALVLRAAPVPAAQLCLFVAGVQPAQTPFGPGLACVAAPFARLPLQTSRGGESTHRRFFVNTSIPGAALTPGTTLYFQCWFRDPAAGSFDYNTSDALALTFTH